MGKAIVYCGDCGKSLHEEDFARGLAHTREGGPYCVACRPLPAGRPSPPPGPAAPSSTGPILKPPSTTRLPAPPAGTRRAVAPSPRGTPVGLVVGGALAGAVVLGVLFLALSGGGGKPSPPQPPKTPPPEAVRSPSDPKASSGGAPAENRIEQEMLARRKREEAARLDRFIGDIRAMMKDAPAALQRRSEIEGMLAAAEKMAGPRRPEVEALRGEWLRRFEEVRKAEQAAPLIAQVREALGDVRRLRQRRKEIEDALSGVERAGAQTEAGELRAQMARALEEAERRGDLLGHWRLDGDARDSSGLGFHGKVKGTKTVPGKVGQALWFDGEGDVVELPAADDLNRIQEESYTIMAWFRPEDAPPGVKEEDNKSWYAVVIKEGMHIGLSYKNSLHFEMGHWAEKDTRAIVMSGKTYPPASWYHLAGVMDRGMGRTRLYVNAVPDGTAEWPAGKASLNFGRKPWRIGHAGPGWKEWAWPAKGAIDDVRLYGAALPAEQIRKIREAGLAGRDP